MTALILAGNSFVGRYLTNALAKRNLKIVASARSPLADFVPCDLTDYVQVEAVIAARRPDWVIQCAAATASQRPDEMERLHVGGTLNVLHAVARHVPSACVLLFGSAAEYGHVEAAALPLAEDYPARPQSAFGQSKLAQLRAAEKTAAEFNLRVLVVRPFNILGPGLPGHYLASALAQQLLRALAERRSGNFPVANARATRDWVDVRDVADAIIGLLMHAPPAPGKIELYNVASGQETPVLKLADKLCQLAGCFKAVPGVEEGSRSGIVRSCGDASKIRRAIGWQPRISWQQSVEELWQAATSAAHFGAARSPRAC